MSIYEELNIVENKVKALNEVSSALHFTETQKRCKNILEHIKYLRTEIENYKLANPPRDDCEVKKDQYIIEYPLGQTLYAHNDGMTMPTSNYVIAKNMIDALIKGEDLIIANVPGWRISQKVDGVFEEIVNTGEDTNGSK